MTQQKTIIIFCLILGFISCKKEIIQNISTCQDIKTINYSSEPPSYIAVFDKFSLELSKYIKREEENQDSLFASYKKAIQQLLIQEKSFIERQDSLFKESYYYLYISNHQFAVLENELIIYKDSFMSFCKEFDSMDSRHHSEQIDHFFEFVCSITPQHSLQQLKDFKKYYTKSIVTVL